MFIVYSKPACPFCDQAKTLLQQKGLPFSEVMLDVGQPRVEGKNYISREELLGKFPGARTVPQITRGDVHIGGFQDLQRVTAVVQAA